MIKHISKALLLMTFILVLFSGCNDYTEYEDMALIFGIGLDYNEKSDTIYTTIDQTNRISNPLGGDSGDASFMNTNIAYAKSFEESLNHLQQYVNRELFLGYTRCLVFGKELCEKNLNDIISYLELTSRIRTSAYVLVAETTAYEILSTRDPSGDLITTNSIEKLLNNTRGTGGIRPITVGDLYKMLYFEGLEISLPVIGIEETIDAGKTDEKKDKVENAGKEKEKVEELELPLKLPETMGYVKQISGQHKIDKFAVFKDTRLIGILDEEESLHLAFIKNNKSRSHITNKIVYNGEVVDYSYLLTNSTSNIKAIIENNKPKIEVNIKLTGTIEKITNLEELFEMDKIEELQNIIAKQMQIKIEKTIKKVQTVYNSDIFGFGYQFYIDKHKEWDLYLKDEWDNLFKDLDVKVNVTAKIINTGKQLRF